MLLLSAPILAIRATAMLCQCLDDIIDVKTRYVCVGKHARHERAQPPLMLVAQMSRYCCFTFSVSQLAPPQRVKNSNKRR